MNLKKTPIAFFFLVLLCSTLPISKAVNASTPGVSCVNKITGDTLDFSCEQGEASVWYNDKIYTQLPCVRLPSKGRGERGPYGGNIGSETDDIYLTFGLGSYGQRVRGHIFDDKIVGYHWDYCKINKNKNEP